MKKFTCTYIEKNGDFVSDTQEQVEATDKESAALFFAQNYPSDFPKISVVWGLVGGALIQNPATLTQQEDARKEAQIKRLGHLYQQTGLSAGTKKSLVDLSYEDLCGLIEHMWEFLDFREELEPEERAIGDELYKTAFFDRDLQAGLQNMILNQIASGQPTAGAVGPGGSNLARNAAMVGGLAALHKLNQIEENTGDVSEGLGFD